MSKVWKELDDYCKVMIWVGSEKIREVTISNSPEQTRENLREVKSNDQVDTIYPCRCDRFYTEPGNASFSGVPVSRVTVYCLHGKPILSVFDLTTGECVRYAEFGEHDPFAEFPANLVVLKDELAVLSSLFEMLSGEHFEEAGKTNTDLSTWKWCSSSG